MKSTGKVFVILLMFLTAGSFSLSAQRETRGMKADSAGMGMHRMGWMPRTREGRDSLMTGRMHRGIGPMYMQSFCPCMVPMWSMPWYPQGRWQQGWGMWMPGRMMRPEMYGDQGMKWGSHGMGMMENIPNLTDKQKKDMADLMQKHRDEMQKFRSDMQKKMKEMREVNKSKLMNLLTDEQKKWLEENTPQKPKHTEPAQ